MFHASFREFIVDPLRCTGGHHIDACKGHEMPMVKCLQLLNRSLFGDSCDLREDRIGALAREIPDLRVILEALRYYILTFCQRWSTYAHLLMNTYCTGLSAGVPLEGLKLA